MARVVGYYLKAGIYVAILFAVAWAAARLAVRWKPGLVSDKARQWAFLVGSGLLLVAGIGRLGSPIETYGGYSRPERLDQAIFYLFSLSGTFLLIYDFATGKVPAVERKGETTVAEKRKSALDLFEKRLHPRDVAEIRGWSGHPELSKLLATLDSIRDWQQFQDYYAEAKIALYLTRVGFGLQYEVPTVDNVTADFRVSTDSGIFFAHLKRTNLNRETRRNLDISTRLRCLEKIQRPIVLSFVPYKSLNDQEMQYCCKEAKKFVPAASEGDRREITMDGESLGEFEIGPRHSGQHVKVDPGLPAVDGGDAPAMRDQLAHAYKRFMPDCDNVILLTSFWRDEEAVADLREALEDFWRDGAHPSSNAVVYFMADPRDDKIALEPFFRGDNTPDYVRRCFQKSLG